MPHDKFQGIGSQLVQFAKTQPDKPAIYYQDTIITYKSFQENIASYQKQLRGLLNAQKTQKVALLIDNEPMFLEVYFAVIMLGWVAVPFDPKWTKNEAGLIKDMAEPDLIITSEAFKQEAAYQFDESVLLDQNKLIESNTDLLFVADAEKEFYLGFTSGSTGTPKGFLRSQLSWIHSFSADEAVFNYDQNDTIIAPGPLNHSLSLFGATHALHIGASFCLPTAFSNRSILNLIKKHRVTVMYGVPTMFHSLASLNETYSDPITFLSSGAKLEPHVKQQLKSLFTQASIYEYYGASELSYITYATDSFNQKYPKSVGLPFPHVQITIRNHQGEILPANQIGDIYVKSPFLFNRYLNHPQATQETLTKYGAFIGDVGFLNELGALTIVGRKNNLMITGGHNVYPEEVEQVIKQSPAVKEAVVVGLADQHWGERIVALIEWKDECHPNLASVKNLCKKHLSIYKRPRKYIPVATFPYTHTNKIARQQILDNLKGLAR